jgi:hypothetical protein
MRRYGVEPSKTRTIVDQLKDYGPSLEDSYLGIRLAGARGLPLSTKLDDLTEDDRRYLGSIISTSYRDIGKEERGTLDSDSWKLINDTYWTAGVAGGIPREILAAPMDGRTIDPDIWKVPAELGSAEAVSAFVEEKLGMPAAQFIEELKESMTIDLGVDPSRIGTNGLTTAEITNAFSGISDYGNSTWLEGIAETFSLQFLRNQLSELQIDDNEMNRYSSVMAQILDGIKGDIRKRRISDKSKELLRRREALLNDPLVRSITRNESGSVS